MPFRIYRYTRCSEACFVLSGIYITRYLRTRKTLNPTNVHRLALMSIVMSAKYLDDAFHTNSYYALVGGLSLQSFNAMEIQFLKNIEFSLFVSRECFDEQMEIHHASLESVDCSPRRVAESVHQQERLERRKEEIDNIILKSFSASQVGNLMVNSFHCPYKSYIQPNRKTGALQQR